MSGKELQNKEIKSNDSLELEEIEFRNLDSTSEGLYQKFTSLDHISTSRLTSLKNKNKFEIKQCNSDPVESISTTSRRGPGLKLQCLGASPLIQPGNQKQRIVS